MPSTTFCTNIPTAVKFTKPKFGAKKNMRLGNDAGDKNISKLLEDHEVKIRFCKCECTVIRVFLNLEEKTVRLLNWP
jgi:hypothetical protein